MARDDLFEWPFLGTLIKSINAFPVRKNSADRTAVREAARRLSEGSLVGVFPEGTRNDSGKLLQLQGGVAVIAKKAKCPIVPVAIEGARRAWPRKYRIFHFSPIQVAFGPPIRVEHKRIEDIVRELEIGIGVLMEKLV
jgi:1-acyl-sn-glycerol-3-phosphate acyltransferase